MRWKYIPDTENKYEVSDEGWVRRTYYKRNGEVSTIKYLHPIMNCSNLRVWIKRYGKRAYFSIHRLVAEAFIPGFDLFNLKQRVKHIDGDITNNNVLNLKIVQA